MQLELRGVPTVTIVASSFDGLYHTVARSMAMPSLPGVITPYPVAPDAEFPERIAARVDAIYDQIVAGLTRPVA